MTGRLIRLTTAHAVVAIVGVAAIISYQHAYGLVRSHGETDLTATAAVDGRRPDLGVDGGTRRQLP